MIEWCSQEMPRWHPVSISGYHIREAGSTAAQELAFTLKDGLTYVEQADRARPRRRRLRAAAVASSSTRRSTSSRRSPSTAPRAGSGRASCATPSAPRTRRSWLMRSHTQTAGVSPDRPAAAQQHRRARRSRRWPACSAARSRCTPTRYDEALALPTEEAVRIALRTQQIIAHETGVANTIDPLGGCYFVEALTDEIEAQAYDYFAASTSSAAWSRRSSRTSPSARSPTPATSCRSEIDAGRRIVVGVNALHRGRRRPDADPEASTRRSSASRSAASQAVRARRDGDRRRAALASSARGGRDRRQPDAAAARLRACPRHARARSSTRSRQVCGAYTETPVF